MGYKQVSPIQEALGWIDGERLGLVEVIECASATNGASATARLDALVKNVPRPGGSSDKLMKAGLKVLRETLTVCSGPSTPSTRWTIVAARYFVSFLAHSQKPVGWLRRRQPHSVRSCARPHQGPQHRAKQPAPRSGPRCTLLFHCTCQG